MAITVESRPSQVISPAGGGYVTAKWNAVRLPIEYTLRTNLFPSNSLDSPIAFNTVSDFGGLARLNLNNNLTLSGFIRVTSDSGDYDGVYSVDVTASNTVLLPVAFAGTTGGSVIREYRNLRIDVEVYEGFPAGHEGAASRPLALLAGTSIQPDSGNEITLDVSPYLESRFKEAPTDYDSATSRLDRWTGFYIAYRETFDTFDSASGLGRTNSSYTSDSANTVYATNSARQFLGISSFDASMEPLPAVVSDTMQVRTGQWLTMFERPKAFDGWPFEASIVYDESVRDELSAGSASANFWVNNVQGSEIDSFAGDETFGIAGFYAADAGASFTVGANSLIGATFDGVFPSPFVTFTEQLDIDLDNSCTKATYFLKWLNPLGGVDQWLFDANKDVSESIARRATFEKDVRDSWTTGPTHRGTYEVEGRRRIRVRSQYVSQNEIEALRWILYSPKVVNVTADGTEKTVNVITDSLRLFTDNDRLFQFTFEVEYTAPTLTQRA